MSGRRNTTYSVVERVLAVEPHPDPRAARIEVILLTSGTRLVVGKHYRAGDRGVYLRPNSLIPGWLAEDLWLVGKKRAHAWFEVRDIPIGIKGLDGDEGPKVQSPGLWCGEWYRADKSEESGDRLEEWKRRYQLTIDADGFVRWPYWREEWREGHCLDGHFGIIEATDPERVITKVNAPEYTRNVSRRASPLIGTDAGP